ncbi:unnamed protein product [Clonostachys rhizophaga]|uniref:Amino acid transporter transmembrane domain-containing protein n=1 Tax=Clonostachys rhizophaga TaxID=160324 RepID=A0A9N9YT92_9HYPO|nr:unnamed protein product [Clonostachys rhizophaga]
MSALNEKKTDPEGLSTMASQGMHDSNEIVHDPVFGEISEDGPDYRNVSFSWEHFHMCLTDIHLGSAILMMKIQIGLGVLALPAAFNDVGPIPGVILLSVVGGILRHREFYGIDDAVQLMFGRVAREAFGFIFCLFWVFAAGSGMLRIAIGLNAITSHGACTAAFVGVAAFLGFSIASIRTLGRLAWAAWFGLLCLLASRPPDAAPEDGHWVSDYKLFNRPTFTAAMNAISMFLIAYSAVPAFFPIAAEMRNP